MIYDTSFWWRFPMRTEPCHYCLPKAWYVSCANQFHVLLRLTTKEDKFRPGFLEKRRVGLAYFLKYLPPFCHPDRMLIGRKLCAPKPWLLLCPGDQRIHLQLTICCGPHHLCIRQAKGCTSRLYTAIIVQIRMNCFLCLYTEPNFNPDHASEEQTYTNHTI